MRGWIAINREFLKWKWFREPEMLSLFIYLLLKVNFAKADMNGVMIDAGELLTSVAAITEATGLTTKQVRYRLSKLKRDKEITITSTPQGSIIKLCNYSQYIIKELKYAKAKNLANQLATDWANDLANDLATDLASKLANDLANTLANNNNKNNNNKNNNNNKKNYNKNFNFSNYGESDFDPNKTIANQDDYFSDL